MQIALVPTCFVSMEVVLGVVVGRLILLALIRLEQLCSVMDRVTPEAVVLTTRVANLETDCGGAFGSSGNVRQLTAH